MISVKITTATGRETKLVDEGITIKKCLDDNNVEYGNANITLDAATLKAGEINKTFKDLGVTESCFLTAIVKTNNA